MRSAEREQHPRACRDRQAKPSGHEASVLLNIVCELPHIAPGHHRQNSELIPFSAFLKKPTEKTESHQAGVAGGRQSMSAAKPFFETSGRHYGNSPDEEIPARAFTIR
jgi:hypothetical protein